MAITRPTLIGVGQMPIARSAPWAVNNNEDDGDTPIVMKESPGAGFALYLTHVTMSGQTLDVAITLADEDGTVLYGPIQMQANGGGLFTKDWKWPLKLTDNKGLYVGSTGQVGFTIYVEGFTGQSPIR